VIDLAELSGAQLALLIGLWTASSLLVFSHAERHGSKRATVWGVATFLASGLVLPFYFLRFWLRRRRGGGAPGG
jgi:hypothetical protein